MRYARISLRHNTALTGFTIWSWLYPCHMKGTVDLPNCLVTPFYPVLVGPDCRCQPEHARCVFLPRLFVGTVIFPYFVLVTSPLITEAKLFMNSSYNRHESVMLFLSHFSVLLTFNGFASGLIQVFYPNFSSLPAIPALHAVTVQPGPTQIM